MTFWATEIPNISYKKVIHGTKDGTYAVDVSKGFWHEITIGGAINLSFTGWPEGADLDVVRYLLAITNPGTNLTLIGAIFHYAGGSAPTYTVSGTDLIGFYSVDGGSNIYVFPIFDVKVP